MYFEVKRIVNWSVFWYTLAMACGVFIICLLGVNNDNAVLYIFLTMIVAIIFYHFGKIANVLYELKLLKAKKHSDRLNRRLKHDYNMKELRVELIEAYVREECRAIIR